MIKGMNILPAIDGLIRVSHHFVFFILVCFAQCHFLWCGLFYFGAINQCDFASPDLRLVTACKSKNSDHCKNKLSHFDLILRHKNTIFS